MTITGQKVTDELFARVRAGDLPADDGAVRAVPVTKRRTRYRIGSIRAEVTEVTIERTGEVLRTLAIEGDDLDELVALRDRLGLGESANVAVHLAIDPDR